MEEALIELASKANSDVVTFEVLPTAMAVVRLIKVNASVAASFGLGVMWFIFMVILPGITYIVVGFSKKIKYIGPDAGPEDFENDEPEGSRFTNPYTSYKDF